MSEARKVTLGRGLSFLLEKSAEEKRKDNLKKYFLDPNCIESLQDEIIRLKTELEGIQVNTKTEYNEIPKKDKRFQLISSTSKYFVEWMEDGEHFPIDAKNIKAYVFAKFIEDNQDFDRPYFKRKTFNIWIKKYAHYKNLTYKDGSSGGKRWFSLYQNKSFMLPPKNIEKNVIDNTKTYLIKNRRNGFYKIGRSKHPLKREQTLQSEEPDIVMVKTWDKDIESLLHKDYKDYRVRGEWFELSKAQVKYICTNYERS